MDYDGLQLVGYKMLYMLLYMDFGDHIDTATIIRNA